jgi:hypothetical protein
MGFSGEQWGDFKKCQASIPAAGETKEEIAFSYNIRDGILQLRNFDGTYNRKILVPAESVHQQNHQSGRYWYERRCKGGSPKQENTVTTKLVRAGCMRSDR